LLVCRAEDVRNHTNNKLDILITAKRELKRKKLFNYYKKNNMTRITTKWYNNIWLIIFFLIVFPPVALLALIIKIRNAGNLSIGRIKAEGMIIIVVGIACLVISQSSAAFLKDAVKTVLLYYGVTLLILGVILFVFSFRRTT
jgi:hypothetical protein